jgi:tetratricopeptide (TPR) repeat protein
MAASDTSRNPPPDSRQPTGKPKTRRVFNLRLLAGTLIAVAILAPAVYWWRAAQERRTASALLDRAKELNEEEKYTAAAGYLFRYLQLQPDHAEARALLAETFDRSLRDAPDRPIRNLQGAERAIAMYQQALGVAAVDQAPALRRALTKLLLETQKYTSANEEATTLLDPDQGGDKDDPYGWWAKAHALYGEYRERTLKADRSAVGAAFVRAAALNPTKVELAATLADFYRTEPQLLSEDEQALAEPERQQRADEIIEKMVAANPKTPEAYLARYSYRVRNRLPQATEDLQAALEHGPKNLTVLLVAASEARREAEAIRSAAARSAAGSRPEGKTESKTEPKSDPKPDSNAEEVAACYKNAIAYYERAIQAAKPHEREEKENAYLGLAQVHLDQQQPDLAIKALQRGLKDVNAESLTLNSQLAGVLIDQGKLQPAEEVLAVLDRISERLGSYVSPTAKAANELANDLLRARLLAKQEKPLQAIVLARRVLTGQKGVSTQERRQCLEAWWLLGSLYGSLGRRDQAADACEQAWTFFEKLATDQLSSRQMGLQLHLQAASAWLDAGRPERAIGHYEAALRLNDAAELWLALARSQLQYAVRLPKEERNWAAFQKVLNEATSKTRPKPLAEPWRVELLRAEAAVIQAQEQGRSEEGRERAIESYRAAEKQYPESTSLLQTLTVAYEQLGATTDADRTLAALKKLPDTATAACLVQSQVYCMRQEYNQARQTLRTGLKTLPADAHAALERNLIDIDRQEGNLAAASRELTQMAEKQPDNLELVCQLAELALTAFTEESLENPQAPRDPQKREQHRQELQQYEKRLRDLEGAGGAYAPFFEARRLVAEAKAASDPTLAQAAELLARVQNLRPAWPAVRLVQAELCERQGKFEEAVAAYEEAIRLGEGRPTAYERLVGLLYQMDRTAEANRYLGLLENRVAGSENLSSLEMALAAGRGQVVRALDMARQRVERRPQDPLAQMWLGQMLLANDKPTEAEAALKKAVELAPNDVRTLGALFGFYVRDKQTDRAKEMLQELTKNKELPDFQRASLLAQGYELLGDREQAKTNYRMAAQKAPKDTGVQVRFAGFLLQNGSEEDTQEAQRVLRGALRQSPGTGSVRLMLAELLVTRGGEKEWQEAQKLMDLAGMDPSPSNVGRRAQAILLARRGGRDNLDKAQKILEGLAADPKRTTATDHWWLARVYEASGKWPDARGQYLKLVEQAQPDPIHLAAYVNLLLRRKTWTEADKWIKKVEELLPEELGTAALRARWLHGQRDTAKIEPLVEAFAEKHLKSAGTDQQQETQIALRVGDLYSAVQQHVAAERWYRRLMKLVPDGYQRVAVALARQGRMREAIELCTAAASAEKADATPRPAMALISVLLAGQPTAADFQQAEPLLAKALESHPKDVGLLLGVASVRVIQQQAAEATKLYRQALSLQPKNPSILNNLATLLAEQGDKSQRQEALANVERAIQILGPQPFLLDTKGMILVLDDRREEALPLLEEAVSTINPDPRYRFHLAVAHDRLGNVKDATVALQESLDGELKQQILTPADWKLLDELEKKLLTPKKP